MVFSEFGQRQTQKQMVQFQNNVTMKGLVGDVTGPIVCCSWSCFFLLFFRVSSATKMSETRTQVAVITWQDMTRHM